MEEADGKGYRHTTFLRHRNPRTTFLFKNDLSCCYEYFVTEHVKS